MQVVRDDLRFDLEDREQVPHRLLEEAHAGRIVEIADMLRDERLVGARDTDRVLERCADREHRRPRSGEANCLRRVATRAAHEHRRAAAVGCDHDRIVAANDDRSVMLQVGVRDARESLESFRVAGHERLAARVRARHHEHQRLRLCEPGEARGPAGIFVKQQPLQRRGRQHHAERREAGRNAVEFPVGSNPFRRDHNRPLGGGKQPHRIGIEHHEARE